MMSIVYVFWMYVILFGVIGAMRGWAKELLVTFSVILSLAVNHVLRVYIPIAKDMPDNDISLFWVRTVVLAVLVFFGYQTVVRFQHLATRAVRERFQDTFIGALFGGVNGYLIAGTILHYMHTAGYPFQQIISRPTDQILPNGQTLAATVDQMMLYMPPQLLGDPGIYFAIIIAFVFVIVVYI